MGTFDEKWKWIPEKISKSQTIKPKMFSDESFS